MSNLKFIVFIILAVLITSCGAKKKVYEKVIERDSISYVLPSDNSFVVSNLCDSIKRPVQVLKTIENGISKSTLQIKGNTLTFRTVTDTIFKEKISYRDRVKLEEKEVPYTPKWIKFLLWFFIALSVVCIAFPKVAKAINVIAKKLIGFPV
jgi:hypothetical protein